jgi:hypothetical protein
MPRPIPLLRRLGLLALLLGLQACSTDPHRQAAQASRERADLLARSGYQPGVEAAVESALQPWSIQGRPTPVALMLPGHGSALPVVVYLPGLGEPAESGLLWRQAWAKAGYAVLSVQPLDEDTQAWSSPLARNFEFKALARERHAPAALRQRVERLARVLDEARRRARDGDPWCSRLDFSHMAVAGYDLGAQAAMALGGEHAVGDAPDTLATQFRSAILLSPVVLGDGTQRERYDGMTRPVLSVSGPMDADPTGLLSTELRGTAFGFMPSGDKFELMLRDADHAALSGRPEVTRVTRDESHGGGMMRQGRRGGGARDPHWMTRTSRRPTGAAMAHARCRPSRTPPRSRPSSRASASPSSTPRCADRPPARRWLDEQAPGWLHGLGTWRTR